MKKFSLSMLLAAGLAAPASGQTIVSVSGNDNPFLAGKPDGTACCSGDSAPAQSPALVPGTVTPGSILTFTAVGSVSNSGGAGPGTADGSGGMSMTADYGTGIAGAQNVNLNGLVGVFLGAGDPGNAAPSPLNSGTTFTSLAPGLQQIFWIGDGFTGTGIGDVQQFTVPTGASRLFLGTVDGFGWFNNSGSFRVSVFGLESAVPEPGQWAMMIVGFGLLGSALRGSRRSRALAAV